MTHIIALERPGAGKPAVWIGTADATGVSIRYGSKGSGLRTMTVPLAECVAGDPERELQTRAAAKLAEGKGYREVPPDAVPQQPHPTFPAQHAVNVEPAKVDRAILDLASALAQTLGLSLKDDQGAVTATGHTLRITMREGMAWAIQASTLNAPAMIFAAGLAITARRQLIGTKGEKINPATVLRNTIPTLPPEQQAAVEALGLFASTTRLLQSIGGPSLAF